MLDHGQITDAGDTREGGTNVCSPVTSPSQGDGWEPCTVSLPRLTFWRPTQIYNIQQEKRALFPHFQHVAKAPNNPPTLDITRQLMNENV